MEAIKTINEMNLIDFTAYLTVMLGCAIGIIYMVAMATNGVKK